MAVVSLEIAFSFVFVIVSFGCIEGYYDNNYDRYLNYECSGTTRAISYVFSVHHNGFEDRRFSISCRDVPLLQARRYSLGRIQCDSSGYWENENDNILAFYCPSNKYIVGMTSTHDDRTEDRRWKFKCCGFRGYYLHGCELTRWTNNFDEEQNFSVPTGKVITGVISFHHNAFEDRRYRYIICNVGYKYM